MIRFALNCLCLCARAEHAVVFVVLFVSSNGLRCTQKTVSIVGALCTYRFNSLYWLSLFYFISDAKFSLSLSSLYFSRRRYDSLSHQKEHTHTHTHSIDANNMHEWRAADCFCFYNRTSNLHQTTKNHFIFFSNLKQKYFYDYRINYAFVSWMKQKPKKKNKTLKCKQNSNAFNVIRNITAFCNILFWGERRSNWESRLCHSRGCHVIQPCDHNFYSQKNCLLLNRRNAFILQWTSISSSVYIYVYLYAPYITLEADFVCFRFRIHIHIIWVTQYGHISYSTQSVQLTYTRNDFIVDIITQEYRMNHRTCLFSSFFSSHKY